jgi:hypothetical protein
MGRTAGEIDQRVQSSAEVIDALVIAIGTLNRRLLRLEAFEAKRQRIASVRVPPHER